MTTVVGPAFSLEAKGKLGNALAYYQRMGQSLVNYFRGNKGKRPRGFSDSQLEQQEQFSTSIQAYKNLTPESKAIYNGVVIGEERMGRCRFMNLWMEAKGPSWEWYPLPPEFDRFIATDDIYEYEKIINDLETLTELSFKIVPAALASGRMPEGVKAYAPTIGLFFVIDREYYAEDGWLYEIGTIAHELTHCLLSQHCYKSKDHPMAHETISYECAVRVVDGDLTPVYTYEGKTLSELTSC